MPSVTVKEDESFESALRRFKKQCEKAGVLSELRKREHYEKPSVRRKKKMLAARKKAMKRMRLLQDARPDIDVAVLKMIAIPGEILLLVGQRLDDEVMRFPKCIHEPDWVFI